jgi:hypothetical protein
MPQNQPAALLPSQPTPSETQSLLRNGEEFPTALELLYGSSAEPAPATPEVLPMSFLSAVGKDAKAFFSWFGSAKGQAIVKTGEGLVQAAANVAGIGQPVQAGLNLVNTWMGEILQTEVIATAAAQQNGSGEQKAAAVVAAMTPQLMSFLQGQNITSEAATAKAKTISDALVLVLNTLGTDAATPTSTTNATATAKA